MYNLQSGPKELVANLKQNEQSTVTLPERDTDSKSVNVTQKYAETAHLLRTLGVSEKNFRMLGGNFHFHSEIDEPTREPRILYKRYDLKGSC